MKALVVTTPFADYEAGDKITDKDAIKAALAASPHCVVPVKVQAEPEKAEPAKAAPKPLSADLPAAKPPNAV